MQFLVHVEHLVKTPFGCHILNCISIKLCKGELCSFHPDLLINMLILQGGFIYKEVPLASLQLGSISDLMLQLWSRPLEDLKHISAGIFSLNAETGMYLSV